MSRRSTAIIRYDGPALSSHEMDVHDLAPALLAIGDLCKVANEVLNGEGAAVKVLVRADIEQKCFQLKLELVQTLYEQFTALLDSEAIQDAKQILEWLGIAGGTVAGGYGLFKLYKTIFDASHGKDSVTVGARAQGSSVVYQVVGDGNQIIVPEQVHRIAQDPRTLTAMKKVLAPLERDGYERLEFESDGEVTEYFTKDQAKRIIQAPGDAIIERSDRELISRISTSVRVKTAVFEGNAKWKVVYKRAVDAKIADADWLERYQQGTIMILPGYKLIVDLEERVETDDDGEQVGEASYTITKVHGVEVPPKQQRLFPQGG